MFATDYTAQPWNLFDDAILDGEAYHAAFGIPLMGDMINVVATNSIIPLDEQQDLDMAQHFQSRSMSSTLQGLPAAAADHVMPEREMEMLAQPHCARANTDAADNLNLLPRAPCSPNASRGTLFVDSRHSSSWPTPKLPQASKSTVRPSSSSPSQSGSKLGGLISESPSYTCFTIEANGRFTFDGRQCRSLTEAQTRMFPGVEWVHINRGHFMPAAGKTGVRTVYMKNKNNVFKRVSGFEATQPTSAVAVRTSQGLQRRSVATRIGSDSLSQESKEQAGSVKDDFLPTQQFFGFVNGVDLPFNIGAMSNSLKRRSSDPLETTPVKRPRLERHDSVQGSPPQATMTLAASPVVSGEARSPTASRSSPPQNNRIRATTTSHASTTVKCHQIPAASPEKPLLLTSAPQISITKLQDVDADSTTKSPRISASVTSALVSSKPTESTRKTFYHNDPTHQISSKPRGPGQGKGREVEVGKPWTAIVSPVHMVALPLGGLIEQAALYPIASGQAGKWAEKDG